MENGNTSRLSASGGTIDITKCIAAIASVSIYLVRRLSFAVVSRTPIALAHVMYLQTSPKPQGNLQNISSF